MDFKRTFFYGAVIILLSCLTIDKTSFVGYSWPPKVIHKAVASTSVIFVEYGTGGALGAGVVISKEGRTLTAAHVVTPNDYKKITMITSDGNEYDIRVLSVNTRSDLALVEPVASAQQFVFSKLQASDKLDVGQDVLIVGHPFSGYWTLTTGIISRLPWSWTYFSTVIETDALVNPGNSGGPVFNIKGEIIGIVSAMRMNTFGPTGIGIAIPIKEIHSFLKTYELKNEKSQQRKRYRIGDVESDWQGLFDALGFNSRN